MCSNLDYFIHALFGFGIPISLVLIISLIMSYCMIHRYKMNISMNLENNNSQQNILKNIFREIIILDLQVPCQCAICIENLERDDRVKILTCGHYYHPNCIDGWLKRHNNCPNCRQNV